MDYQSHPFGRWEALTEPAVVATYIANGSSYADILRRAGSFAVGQTVGTWLQVPGISQDMVEHYQGRVLGVYDAGWDGAEECTSFVLRVAFPAANFGDSLTMLLTALLGNDVSTALQTRLVNVELCGRPFPQRIGPRQGIAELRGLTGVTGRPLVLNMIKPCAGFSPNEGAKLFYQVARGGVDLIKDDELLASPVYNEVQERVQAYEKAADAAYEETGKRPVYLPNISGPPSQVLDNAKAVLEAGGRACLINYVFGGADLLAELADTFGEQLFIMAHYAGAGAMQSWNSGISGAVLLGFIPRLAGAHAVMTMAPRLDDSRGLYNFRQTVQAQKLSMKKIKPMVPTVGGGITPVSQAVYQRELGDDCILGIGGAIQGHPMGTTAGAQAAMAAVQAAAAGIPLAQAAAGCAPLRRALELWGGDSP